MKYFMVVHYYYFLVVEKESSPVLFCFITLEKERSVKTTHLGIRTHTHTHRRTKLLPL